MPGLSYNPDPIEARRAGVKANGTTDDSAALQAAINAAQTQGRGLILPHGTIRLNTGLTITKAGFNMIGQGVGQTTLKPQGSIVGLTVSPASTSMSIPTIVEKFTMDGTTYIAQTNTGIQIPLGRPAVVLRDIYLTQFDCCLDTTGQFCLFERIGCYFSNLGYYLHQALGVNGGGGNNNVWSNIIAQSNNVGFMGVNDSDFDYPLHSNEFHSSSFHDNTTCGLYLAGAHSFHFDTPAHENNGLSGPATRVVKGQTINKSSWHLHSSVVTATAFQCVTGSPDPNYVFESACRITFLDGMGTSMYTSCDAETKLNFEGAFDMYGRVTNIVTWPAAQSSLNPVVLVGEPNRTPSAMPNTFAAPRSVGLQAVLPGTVATELDATFGQISAAQFAASVGSDSVNVAYFDTKSGTYAGVGNTIAATFLLRSSVDCVYGMVGWGGNIPNTTRITLLAGKVYRVTLIFTTKATPTSQVVAIWPTTNVGPKLHVWDGHGIYSNTGTSPQNAPIISAFVREGWFNPVAALPTYAITNVTTDRAFDADTVAVAELADAFGTLVADLRARGILL